MRKAVAPDRRGRDRELLPTPRVLHGTVTLPTTLAAYRAGLDPDQRAALDELRRRAQAQLRGFDEEFAYGMPYFRRGPTVGVGVAVRGKGIAIYANDAVVAPLAARRPGLDHGKGCVRFPRREKVDWDLVDEILRAVSALPS